jgi:hypothetical protein
MSPTSLERVHEGFNVGEADSPTMRVAVSENSVSPAQNARIHL